MSEMVSKVYLLSSFFVGSYLFGLGKKETKKNKKSYGKLLIIISFVITVIPIGLRKSGIDHEIYYEWYNNARYWLVDNYHFTPEPLFASLVLFCKYILNNFQYLYLISAILFLIGIYKELYRSCNNIYLGMFFVDFFLYAYMCGLVRLSIAVGVVAYSCKYLDKPDKKNQRKFFFLTMIAVLFHYSAIINILIFLVYKSRRQITWKMFLLFVVGAVVINVLFVKYINVFPYVIRRYSYFSSYSFEISAINNFIMVMPAVFLFFLMPRVYTSNHIIGYKLKSIMILLIYIMFLSMLFRGVFRLIFYFVPFIAYIYSETPNAIIQHNGGRGMAFLFEIIYTVMGATYALIMFNSSYVGRTFIPLEFGALF